MLAIKRSQPHHVPVVFSQRREASNLTAGGHASTLITDLPHNTPLLVADSTATNRDYETHIRPTEQPLHTTALIAQLMVVVAVGYHTTSDVRRDRMKDYVS